MYYNHIIHIIHAYFLYILYNIHIFTHLYTSILIIHMDGRMDQKLRLREPQRTTDFALCFLLIIHICGIQVSSIPIYILYLYNIYIVYYIYTHTYIYIHIFIYTYMPHIHWLNFIFPTSYGNIRGIRSQVSWRSETSPG